MSRSLKDRWSSRLARASLFALVALGALAAVALAATINGTSGNDTLIGTSAADTINGLGGNDQIFSNQGKDTDSGGSGWALADTRDVGQRRRLTSVLPMGAWVLREACAQLATWSAAFPNRRPPKMSINVSLRELAEPGYPGRVAAAAKAAGVAPDQLVLELAASRLTPDSRSPMVALEELKRELARFDAAAQLALHPRRVSESFAGSVRASVTTLVARGSLRWLAASY